jgi:hypothetical protein
MIFQLFLFFSDFRAFRGKKDLDFNNPLLSALIPSKMPINPFVLAPK